MRFRTLSALFLGLAAACACPPEARRLVETPDFSTPEAASRSFLAALGCDDAEAEYRCLADRFKEELGAGFDAWLLARPRLREEAGPALDLAFQAESTGRRDLPPEEGRRRVLLWWGRGETPYVGFVLEEQYWWSLETRDGRRFDDLLAEPPARALSSPGRGRLLLGPLELPVPRWLQPEAVRSLTLGTEWRIRDLLPPPEP